MSTKSLCAGLPPAPPIHLLLDSSPLTAEPWIDVAANILNVYPGARELDIHLYNVPIQYSRYWPEYADKLVHLDGERGGTEEGRVGI